MPLRAGPLPGKYLLRAAAGESRHHRRRSLPLQHRTHRPARRRLPHPHRETQDTHTHTARRLQRPSWPRHRQPDRQGTQIQQLPDMNVKIDPTWYEVLRPQFESPYFVDLKQFLVTERTQHTCYPPGSKIFAAFDSTPFDKVKAVIIGQDPYHEPGQAMGLCFSVPQGYQIHQYKTAQS